MSSFRPPFCLFGSYYFVSRCNKFLLCWADRHNNNNFYSDICWEVVCW